MRIFYLNRLEDESGVSGTGRVAHVFVADNGKVAVFWLSEVKSVTLYDNVGEVTSIHSHQGKTEVIFEPDWKRAYGELTSALDTSLLDLALSKVPPEGVAAQLLKEGG